VAGVVGPSVTIAPTLRAVRGAGLMG